VAEGSASDLPVRNASPYLQAFELMQQREFNSAQRGPADIAFEREGRYVDDEPMRSR
jgi:hypothetical protein